MLKVDFATTIDSIEKCGFVRIGASASWFVHRTNEGCLAIVILGIRVASTFNEKLNYLQILTLTGDLVQNAVIVLINSLVVGSRFDQGLYRRLAKSTFTTIIRSISSSTYQGSSVFSVRLVNISASRDEEFQNCLAVGLILFRP
ncbi:hypothetical protein HG530_013266 [Fusarium avenaceum]|nr:hypothetical protein HG530_013266 [Fusarium avenaceum]